MKRWLAVLVASAALLASTASPPEEDPVIEEEPTVQKRTDAGLEFEILSTTNLGSLDGVWVQAGDGANPLQDVRDPDGGINELLPRTYSATANSNGATASGSMEFQRLDAGHFRFILNASASSPDGNNAKALAGIDRIEVTVRDRGLKGLKLSTSCTANITKAGNIWADGALKVVAGETISGDTVCAFNRFDPTKSSGAVQTTSSEENDGTDRHYARLYMDVGASATSHMFGDLDGGSATNASTVDVLLEPQY